MKIGSFTLRPYQNEAVEELRQNIRRGVRRQILSAATGAGKTVCGMAMIAGAVKKGKRAAFVCDRQALVHQTSQRMHEAGIKHGILMGDSTVGTTQPVRVCSAQTLEKRGFHDVDLMIIDEAHVVRKAVVEHTVARDVLTVGMTATPMTEGLGKYYSEIVNVRPTTQLIGEGHLTPLKVIAPTTTVDTEGLAVAAGEWKKSDVGERAMRIVGDVVAEWERTRQEHFGGKVVPTIAFCASVADAESLAEEMNGAGYRWTAVSYRQSAEEKDKVIAAYRAGEYDGIANCAVLERGFDAPETAIIIDQYPLRSALMTELQRLGRVMRNAPGKEFGVVIDHCVEASQRVLTQRGLVAICKVRKDDLLWDGVEWVSHDGAVLVGHREVMTYAGLTATGDHKVWTRRGWLTLREAAETLEPIAQTGIGRFPLRLSGDRFAGGRLPWAHRQPFAARPGRMRGLWLSCHRFAVELAERTNDWLSRLQQEAAAVSVVASPAMRLDEGAVPQPEPRKLRKLRWPWHRVPVAISKGRGAVGGGESRSTRGPGERRARSDRHGRPLRARQPSMGVAGDEPEQQAQDDGGAEDARLSPRASGRAVRGLDAAAPDGGRTLGRGDHRAVGAAFGQAEGEVWDIHNAGPRNRFTCEGLLTHNSENFLAFAPHIHAFYDYGIQSLDDGERTKATRDADELEKRRKETVCRSCGTVIPPGVDVCPSCGTPRPRRPESPIDRVSGKMGVVDEVDGKGRVLPFQGDWWAELCAVASQITDDDDRARRIALAKYRDTFGRWPRGREFQRMNREPHPEVAKHTRRRYQRWKIAQRKGAGSG